MDEAMQTRWRDRSEDVLSGRKNGVRPTRRRLFARVRTRCRNACVVWTHTCCKNPHRPGNRQRGQKSRKNRVRSVHTVEWPCSREGNGNGTCTVVEEQRSVWSARLGPVRRVGWVFVPLDEHLGLTTSSLTPRDEEPLVHGATGMPFAHTTRLLETLVGVQVHEATVRHPPEQAGKVCEGLHNEPEEQAGASKARREDAPRRVALRADGAGVSLVRGVWADVRTLAIGEVTETGGAPGRRESTTGSRCVTGGWRHGWSGLAARGARRSPSRCAASPGCPTCCAPCPCHAGNAPAHRTGGASRCPRTRSSSAHPSRSSTRYALGEAVDSWTGSHRHVSGRSDVCADTRSVPAVS